MSLVGVTNIGGSVVDNVSPVTGLIGWRSVVELRRLRLVLMRVELECGVRLRVWNTGSIWSAAVDDEMDW